MPKFYFLFFASLDGAALIYVSAKNGKNCGLLSSYLQHRIYGFPFTQNAYVIDKDSVFMCVCLLFACVHSQSRACSYIQAEAATNLQIFFHVT